jgi:hypothetical protein
VCDPIFRNRLTINGVGTIIELVGASNNNGGCSSLSSPFLPGYGGSFVHFFILAFGSVMLPSLLGFAQHEGRHEAAAGSKATDDPRRGRLEELVKVNHTFFRTSTRSSGFLNQVSHLHHRPTLAIAVEVNNTFFCCYPGRVGGSVGAVCLTRGRAEEQNIGNVWFCTFQQGLTRPGVLERQFPSSDAFDFRECGGSVKTTRATGKGTTNAASPQL